MIALTGAIVFFAFVSATITKGQLDEMRSSGEDTKRLIAATEKSAQAARDAVRIAEDTAKHRLRAYLSPKRPKFILDEEAVKINVDLENVGQTPANIVAKDFSIKIIREGASKGVLVVPYEDLPKIFIGQGSSGTIYAKLALASLDSEAVASLKTPATQITVDLSIEYRDVFGEAHHMRIQFRRIRNGGEWDLIAGPNGAEAD